MHTVATVRGNIPARQMGFSQCHEHLCVEKGFCAQVDPALCIDDPAGTLMDLNAYRRVGGRSIWDAQGMGSGRNAQTLLWLSEQSNVHIVASTGFHKMIFFPPGHWIFQYSASRLAALYIRELREGMFLNGGPYEPNRISGIRAGLIKTALDSCGLTRQYQKVFCAAAWAAVETGAPMMIHIEKESDPVMLAHYLFQKGVPYRQMIFCHLDRAVADMRIHFEVAERGAYLEYDTIAREKYHSDEKEINIIQAVLEKGLEDRLLIGLDTTRNRLSGYGGFPGLDYIGTGFIPKMKAAGIHEDSIRRFFVENPAKVFEAKAESD